MAPPSPSPRSSKRIVAVAGLAALLSMVMFAASSSSRVAAQRRRSLEFDDATEEEVQDVRRLAIPNSAPTAKDYEASAPATLLSEPRQTSPASVSLVTETQLFETPSDNPLLVDNSDGDALTTAAPITPPTESPLVTETQLFETPSDTPLLVDNSEGDALTTAAPITPPTKSPSLRPTPAPTTAPTKLPTLSPTSFPSESRAPSSTPSSLPSFSTPPSARPSALPSASSGPSAGPSSSASPTDATLHSGLKVTLWGVRAVEDLSEWEDATAGYFESVYNGEGYGGGSAMEGAVVRIRLTGQNTLEGGRRTLAETETLRSTTTRGSSVVVTYSQSTTYRRLDPDLSEADALRLPLGTEARREEYASGLRRDLEGYEDLTDVSGVSTPYDDNGTVESASDVLGLSVAHIVGIVCGSVAFLALLIGGIVCYRRRDKEEDYDGLENDGLSKDGMAEDRVLATTLPSDPGAPRNTEECFLGDMSVASEDPFLGEGVCGAAEELLTVYAPAGKLGMVIDSPDVGAPVVHDVKDASPIVDKVRAGDRLVAVDDEDVRALSAIKVSRLISRKSKNSRKLIVVRRVVAN